MRRSSGRPAPFKQYSPVSRSQLILHIRVRRSVFLSPSFTENILRRLASSYQSGSMKCLATTALLVSMSLVSCKIRISLLGTNNVTEIFSRSDRGTETEEWEENSGRVGPPGPGSELRAQGEDVLSRQHCEEVWEHLRPGLRQRGHHAHADAGVRERGEINLVLSLYCPQGLCRPSHMC